MRQRKPSTSSPSETTPFLTSKPQTRTHSPLKILSLLIIFGLGVIYYRNSPLDDYSVCSNNKSIYTMDNREIVDCITISKSSGLITAVGNLRNGWNFKKQKVYQIGTKHKLYGAKEKEGKENEESILPGLIDSHVHILQNGESKYIVDLTNSKSIQECKNRIANFITENNLEIDLNAWIGGSGWDQTKFYETGFEFPTAADLEADIRLAGRKIWLKRVDVHAIWISQTLLSLLEDLPETVVGGAIIRDGLGQPNGIFVDLAMQFVTDIIPKWTDEDRLKFLTVTAKEALSKGLTTLHDASLSLEDISFLIKLDKADQLPIRIYGMVACFPINSFCQVEKYSGNRFNLRSVKIFTDGALGSYGAAMIEPYSDSPERGRGILISPEETFLPLITKWAEAGFQINSHVIGDRAAKIILDAYESLLPKHGNSLYPSAPLSLHHLRLRLEHAQIMTQEDIKRAGRLGIIGSFQPTHQTSDMGYAEARIGPERIKGAYAWRSYLNARIDQFNCSNIIPQRGAITLGSDFPVEGVSPFNGIYSAVTRTDQNGNSPHGPKGWYPEESLTLEETMFGFTTWGAYAGFLEEEIGQLKIGMKADFIILDRDLFKIESKQLLETKVRATVIGGMVEFGKL